MTQEQIYAYLEGTIGTDQSTLEIISVKDGMLKVLEDLEEFTNSPLAITYFKCFIEDLLLDLNGIVEFTEEGYFYWSLITSERFKKGGVTTPEFIFVIHEQQVSM